MWNKALEKNKNRVLWLDIAKAYGIFLVVINHLDIHIPLVTFFGGMFYMPVFFVAAGYTYRRKEESFKAFAIGKAKRLLLPYLVCNILLVGFYMVRTGSLSKRVLEFVFFLYRTIPYCTSMIFSVGWTVTLKYNL